MEASVRNRIERECARLIVWLIYHYDHGEAEQAATLFTADALWVQSRVRFQGHKAIIDSFAAQSDRVMRHFTSNILTEVRDESHAEAVTYYLAFVGRRGDGLTEIPLELPVSLGEWQTSFLATPGGWKIARHGGSRIFGRMRNS